MVSQPGFTLAYWVITRRLRASSSISQSVYSSNGLDPAQSSRSNWRSLQVQRLHPQRSKPNSSTASYLLTWLLRRTQPWSTRDRLIPTKFSRTLFCAWAGIPRSYNKHWMKCSRFRFTLKLSFKSLTLAKTMIQARKTSSIWFHSKIIAYSFWTRRWQATTKASLPKPANLFS